MDITITLSDDEVSALTAEFAPVGPSSTAKTVDVVTEFIQRVKHQIVDSAVSRQKSYAQNSRFSLLQQASKTDIASIDAILNKYK